MRLGPWLTAAICSGLRGLRTLTPAFPLVFVAALSFCRPAATRSLPDTRVDGVDALRRAYQLAYNRGDTVALRELYESDAVRMAYDAPEQRGRASILQAYAIAFARRRDPPQLLLEPNARDAYGPTVIERGKYVETFSQSGRETVERGKYAAGLRQGTDGRWRYSWSIFNRDAAPLTSARSAIAVLGSTGLDSVRWQSWGAGLEAAFLQGDPSVADKSYTIALRLQPGRWIAPHYHPHEVSVFVVSGGFLYGHGAAFDTTTVTRLPAGTLAVVAAEHVHFEGAREPTVVLMYGVGPLKTMPSARP